MQIDKQGLLKSLKVLLPDSHVFYLYWNSYQANPLLSSIKTQSQHRKCLKCQVPRGGMENGYRKGPQLSIPPFII